MARLPNLLHREQLPEHLREAYDRVAGLRQGAVSGPYGVLLHSPELAERVAALERRRHPEADRDVSPRRRP